MKFKHTKLALNLDFDDIENDNFDVNSLKYTKEDLQKEIDRLTALKYEYHNYQLALKVFLNTFYGVFGNPSFICYYKDFAEAITLQGRHLIRYSRFIINEYARKYWHLDKKLHSKLGIKTPVEKIKDDTDCVIYIDTDSNYINFSPFLNSFESDIDYQKDDQALVNFILKFYNYRFKDLLEDNLAKYARNWNTKNLQKFKMEGIAKNGIFLVKKRYILNFIWAGGIQYKDLTNLKFTGIEIIRNTTPTFIREKLTEIIIEIFKQGKALNQQLLIQLVKKWKDEYKLASIDDASLSITLNHYEQYVFDDKKQLKLNKKCPIHIRAAALYNYFLHKNPTLKKKYSLLKNGDRMKYFYTKNQASAFNVFGYIQGNYPQYSNIQLPQIDYDLMFNKTFLEPINKILKVIYNWTIPTNLVMIKRLF